MLSAFGSFLLTYSVVTSAFPIIIFILFLHYKNDLLCAIGIQAVRLHFLVLLTCTVCLIILLSIPDFSVLYVAEHANWALPLFYKITSLWAGQAGSMLWWNFLIVFFSLIAMGQVNQSMSKLTPYVSIILMFVSLFFCLLTNFSEDSDPFRMILMGDQPAPQIDGRGLNPLLQHWAMVIHPPILYLGYVSFVVPYAITFSALIQRRTSMDWLLLVRKWTLFSWFFLGTGMLLGGKWAYEELGWGGYWAWDPVENAALMPWLTSTAFLHSILVQRNRGMLKIWNVILVSISFVMCIFGTFLTRSGIVNSVHSFASSSLGPFFLYFIGIIIVFSIFSICRALPQLKTRQPIYSFFSKEAGFLLNNILLLIMLFVIFWGTMYPAITEVLLHKRISVSAVWFNQWITPLGLIILLLTSLGPLLAWRKTSLILLWANVKWGLMLAGICSVAIVALNIATIETWETGHLWAFSIISVSLFLIIITLQELYKIISKRMHHNQEKFWIVLLNLFANNRGRYLGYIIHISIAIMCIGFSGKAFSNEKSISLKINEAEHFSNYLIHLDKYQEESKKTAQSGVPLYVTRKLTLSVFKNNHKIDTRTTEIRVYPMYNLQTQQYDDAQNTSEPAIFSKGLHDLYIQFGGIDKKQNRFIIQVWYNPLVRLVWLGFLLYVIAGLGNILPIDKLVFSLKILTPNEKNNKPSNNVV